MSGYFSKNIEFRKNSDGLSNPVICYAKGKEKGYLERSEVPTNTTWIDNWKVFIPRANNIGTELADDNLNSFVGLPGEICTESFLVVGANKSLSEKSAANLSKYLRTRFVRFLHGAIKVSQDATAKTWRLVPAQDFDQEWTDEKLFEKYSLTPQEIEFIENTIKAMEVK